MLCLLMADTAARPDSEKTGQFSVITRDLVNVVFSNSNVGHRLQVVAAPKAIFTGWSVSLCRNQHFVNNMDDTIISSNIRCCDCGIIHFDAAIRSINFHL